MKESPKKSRFFNENILFLEVFGMIKITGKWPRVGPKIPLCNEHYEQSLKLGALSLQV